MSLRSVVVHTKDHLNTSMKLGHALAINLHTGRPAHAKGVTWYDDRRWAAIVGSLA